MKTFFAIIIGLFCVFGQSVSAQKVQPPKTLTLAQQQEDFKIFRGSLNEIHVGLNWFIGEKELNDLFDSTYNSLTENTRTEDYYVKLRYIMASLRHGHNGITLPQEDGVNYRLSSLAKSKKFLPFAIRILNNRVFVAVNASANEKLTTGTEIVSINGEAVSQIIEKQLPLMFANGQNTSFKIGNLEGYYQFHYLYQMMNPGVERFKIEAVPYNSKEKQTFEIEGELPQTISERYEKITGKNISKYVNLLQYRVVDEKNKIAYLKIGSFYKGLAGNYEQFLDKTFTEIKQSGIKHLIVDVRQNEGGGDGFWQMAYVYTTGNSLTEGNGLLSVKGDKFSYFKYVENPSLELMAFANNPYDVIYKTADGKFRLKPQFKSSDDAVNYPAPPNAFSDKLYVLTDGLTFSAGIAYVTSVNYNLRKQNRFVKFIGEEPGDDLKSGVGSSGTSATIVLPNSKIKVSIPLLGGGDVPYSMKPNSPIPDYRVIPTAKDLVNGADTELNFTVDLIKKKFLK
jgi:Peptidase family S41